MRFVLAAALVFVLAPAWAERRVALVIGNDRYAELTVNEQFAQRRKTPTRDSALERQGFRSRHRRRPLDAQTFNRGALRFRRAIAARRRRVLLLFRPRLALRAPNYLLASTRPKPRARRARGRAVRRSATAPTASSTASSARRRARGGGVLDACRDNPFTRRRDRGLCAVARPRADVAAVAGHLRRVLRQPGQSAIDRLGEGDPDPNGVFTREFVPRLRDDPPCKTRSRARRGRWSSSREPPTTTNIRPIGTRSSARRACRRRASRRIRRWATIRWPHLSTRRRTPSG